MSARGHENNKGIKDLMTAGRKGHAEVARLLRHGRAEKPLPSINTSAASKGVGGEEDLNLSDFPTRTRNSRAPL